jgi:nitrite reductase (NO-forming)
MTTPYTAPVRPPRQDTLWSTMAAVIASVALVVAFVAVFANAGSDGAGAAPVTEQTVEVTLGDLFIEPSSVTIAPHTRLKVAVHNTGAMQHDFKLRGDTGTKLLDPGASQTVDLGVIDASTQAWCTVPGHKAAGMVFDIEVAGAGAAAPTGTDTGTAAEPKDATIDFDAAPAADWKPYDPALAPAPGGTEHEVTLHAVESTVEVAPGVTQELWTFDGTAPGPVLRGRVGDLFTVTLVNDGKMGHSIDFHASKAAWNVEMRTIQPGESLVYQFTADHAGIWMYHCGTAPALHHIGNGMFGAVIIDPPDLAPVAHEYVVVQSELYLGPQGQPGDLTKMQHEDFDAVVFNGYVNQYVHAPIKVRPGERIRVWVLDAGPSESSAFHIVGTIFDTVYKEGAYLLRPDAGHGGSQVLDLQPAQGGFVELSFAEAGQYPMVTHKFANAGKGAMGMFEAGTVTDPVAGGH